MTTLPTFTDVQAAYERIKDHVTTTPIVSSSLLNAWLGHTVLFKAECLQRTGSFKLRGATNFIHHQADLDYAVAPYEALALHALADRTPHLDQPKV